MSFADGFDLGLDLELISLNQNCAHSFDPFLLSTVSFDDGFDLGLDLESVFWVKTLRTVLTHFIIDRIF